MIPNKVFFTKGVGRNKERLLSFEEALRDAGIEKYNLVHVSSILPPNAEIISKEKGLAYLHPGEVVFCVMARNETNESSRLIASSIGCAIPAEKDSYGYLSEHHSYGEKEDIAGDYAEDLAATMLASTLGISFDSNQAWDEREIAYKMSGKIVRTRNITQSAECGPDGKWTTVIAAAVLVEDKGLEAKVSNPNP
ncbi:MAG: arginine decarboxylase, pyruvoyl-dependent [Candidatus Pacearchaeota archaeon]|jgi:arginine decarboxylase